MTTVLMEYLHWLMILQKRKKIQEVRVIERTMAETLKSFSVFFPVLRHELIWTVVHQHHQLPAFSDDCRPVTPSECRGKETGYLYVLLFRKQVWNCDRIGSDE